MGGPPSLPDEVLRLLRRANELRRADRLDGSTEVESEIERRFGAGSKLAVYGSLAPGRQNHAQLEEISGTWRQGLVRGDLYPHGWGQTIGFPALSWRADGEPVPVQLLTSPLLVQHWARLDRFEGREYVRTLVPVETETGTTVANIYEIRGS